MGMSLLSYSLKTLPGMSMRLSYRSFRYLQAIPNHFHSRISIIFS